MVGRLLRGFVLTSCAAAFALVSLASATNAQIVAVGDLNGDNSPDAVIANSASNSVSALLNRNDGSGSFHDPVTYPAGPGPTSVVIVDVNGDGKPDVVVCSGSAGTVSVLFNKGDGTLSPPVSYSVLPAGDTSTPSPSALAVGDIRNSGNLDIVVANYATSTVSILRGDGHGAFRCTATYPVGKNPNSVALARFTSLGNLDIVTANTNGRNVSILTGNGDGTFQAAKNTPAGYVPYSVIAADFNGDGLMDVAVCDNMGLNSGIDLLLGNGDGTLKSAAYFPGGKSPVAMACGDFNGDGKPDLAIVNTGTQDVSVFLNNGTGGFAPPITIAPGVNHIGIAAGDFDGGGSLELILVNSPSGITVVPGAPPTVRELAMAPPTIITGGRVMGIVHLTRAAPSEGVNVTLVSDQPDLLWVPQSIQVPAGMSSISVPLTAMSPLTGSVHITATTNTISASASLLVKPVPPAVPKGDLNGDGVVDMLDVEILARIADGLDVSK
jgi:hypothetical protein